MKQLLKYRYTPGIILFIISMVIGMICYKDYGVAFDEPLEREATTVIYNYVFRHDQKLKTYDWRYVPVGFELPLVMIEKVLHLDDTRDIYRMRHLATNIFFLLCVFIAYMWIYNTWKDQFIACMGYVLLAFNPRLYAHSFFNSKDIPFLCFVLLIFIVGQLAFKKNKLSLYFLLGSICGYSVGIRVMGYFFIPCFGLFFMVDFVNAIIAKDKWLKIAGGFLLFIGGFLLFMYVSSPILWEAPIRTLGEQYALLKKTNGVWDGSVLFYGKSYPGKELPWTYTPAWFCITIPILWLLAGMGGVVWVLVLFIKKPLQYLKNTPERNFLLYGMCFVLPVLLTILSHGVNYDDWRHLYFIYPAFVMFVLYTIYQLKNSKLKKLAVAGCMIQTGATSIFMIQNHPYQQVYFNVLVSHKEEYLRKNFDFEYFGCAYMQAYEYILTHDKSPAVRMYCNEAPVINNINILPDSLRKRIVLVGWDENPDYFITNFRNHPDDYKYPSIIYEQKVLNSTVVRVYKMHL